MTGVEDVSELLRSMDPVIRQTDLVFCTLGWENLPETPIDPLLLFKEVEGFTVVIPRVIARRLGLSYGEVWTWIELSVQSSLTAIGFIAAISTTLAKHEISVNVVSAYHHDHLFVREKDAKKAIKVLKELSSSLGS